MIYVILNSIDYQKDDDYSETGEYQDILRSKIIRWVSKHIKQNEIEYKIIIVKKHIFKSQIDHIDRKLDIVIWHPIVASSNLEMVKYFYKSVVILERPTLLIQKISDLNPINEQVAINSGFYILYLYPKKNDITNEDWKIVVPEDLYLLDNVKLLKNFLITEENNYD